MSKLPCRSRAKKKQIDVDVDRIAKLVRLLGSDKAGEVVAAVGALKRTLAAGGLDLHDLADAVEVGLRPAPKERVLGPPDPALDDWAGMCWFLHFHRNQLQKHQRERVADMLLGTGFPEGRCTPAHLIELRRLVSGIRGDAA